MLRFFIGLGFGVTLTVYSFAFVGVGHGTYVPMAFTASLIALTDNWGAIPAVLLAPLLWALYFLLIPRIRRRWMRITTTVAVLFCHVLTGMWLGMEDHAFKRALSEERRGLMIFGVLVAIAMTSLFYFAVRGDKKIKS
jgi:hypothetical protein